MDKQWTRNNYRNLHLPRKLDALSEMLGFACWSRIPLKVHFLTARTKDLYHEKRSLPRHVGITEGPLEVLASLFSSEGLPP